MDTNATTDYLRLKHEVQQCKLEYEQKKEFVSCSCENAIKNIKQRINLPAVYDKFKNAVEYALKREYMTATPEITYDTYRCIDFNERTVENFPTDINKIKAIDLYKHCPTYKQEYCDGLAKEFKERGFNILSAEYNEIAHPFEFVLRCKFKVKLD